MSDYNKNEETIILNGKKYKWYDIWDALYYNLINQHYNIFSKIYSMHINNWAKKSKKEKDSILKLAKLYLDYLKV